MNTAQVHTELTNGLAASGPRDQPPANQRQAQSSFRWRLLKRPLFTTSMMMLHSYSKGVAKIQSFRENKDAFDIELKTYKATD